MPLAEWKEAAADKPHAFRCLALFLGAHFTVWTILPLFRTIPHFDSIEALAWGVAWEWGTPKHPPLSGWIAEIFLLVFRDPDLSLYVLSQICVLTAFLFIYGLARRYLAPDMALLSVMFLEGTTYYSIQSVVYNVNVLSLALVAGVSFFFHRAVTADTFASWLGVGFFAGLAMLTKYSNGIVLFSLGLYLPLTPNGRKFLKRSGPYLALALSVLLFLPHVLWLARLDFVPLEYARRRTGDYDLAIWQLCINTAKVVIMQFVDAGGALALFAFAFFTTPREKRTFRKPADPLPVFIGLFPLAVMVVVIMLGDIRAKAKWAYAFTGYFPLLLFYLFPVAPKPAARRWLFVLPYIVMAAFAATSLGVTLLYTSKSTHFDARNFAARMRDEWNGEVASPLRYVDGTRRYTSYVSTYLKERPAAYLADEMVWMDAELVRKHGVLVVATSRTSYEERRKWHPELPEARHMKFPVRSRWGKEESMDVYFGIVAPEGQ